MLIKNTIIFLIALFSFAYADGLLLPANEEYPKDLLKNRLTHVTVNINGIIAETKVYQEFLNEWHKPVDAVYSFPLPDDARATNFLYWFNDTLYQAVLEVKEQATNPGTGEGGIAAEINRYIGRNGIKISLKNIPANSVQRVELHYISKCDYYMGKSVYTYPLDTKEFITYPYEHLQFSFNVNSNSEIISYELPGYDNIEVKQNKGKELQLELIKPKSYVHKDLEFNYQVNQNNLGVDFYSINNDTSEGHFTLLIKPEGQADPDSVFAKRIIFLLSNSMSAYKLEESVSAINDALDLLSEKDYFNIILFNYNVFPWKLSPVQASAENINTAKTYLVSLNRTSGWQLEAGLQECFDQITEDSLANSILLFSDGRASIDPREIEAANILNTGIFPIAIDDNHTNRARLEMTASLNYGFVTYIDEDENIHDRILRVFNQISKPILIDTYFEFGNSNISQIVPSKTRSTYAGSYFFMAGRYGSSGESALSMAGTNPAGFRAYNFTLDYADQANNNKFVEYHWAKETMDALEWEIEIYSETPVLKNTLIALSLKYNIRCRYTAYIADYETVPILTNIIEEQEVVPISFIAGNYPNPFNPETKIRIFIDQQSVGKSMYLKIYNILGQLVAVIDISNLQPGWHNVLFSGLNIYGNRLSSGMYIVQLQQQNNIAGTIRIHLIQ